MNGVDWWSVFTRGIVGLIFGPPVAWALWYCYSSIDLYFRPRFDAWDGFLEAIFAGAFGGPVILISWELWGELLLARLSSRSRQRKK
jgi:hypothetical protein